MCVFILLKTGSHIPVPLYFKYETSTLLEGFCHFSVKNIMGDLDVKLPFKCSRMIKMIRSRFSSYFHLLTSVRPKKNNYMFLRHRPRHLQPPPHQKFLLHFQYSHLKIIYTSRIVSLGRPSFAAILFVDWLVRILKVENFSGNYSDTSFFSISFKKIKNKKPPARIIF